MTTPPTSVLVRDAGRNLLVAAPDGRDRARLGVDLAVTFARARAAGADACVLRPQPLVDEALFAVQPAAAVQRVQPRGAAGAWLRTRWRAAAARQRGEAALTAAVSSFWREMYRELRRHVPDERLPYRLRTRLRERAHEALARAERLDRTRGGATFPRRLLRDPVAVELPPPLEAAARAQCSRQGLDPDRPLVALEEAADVARYTALETALRAAGVQVAPVRTELDAGGLLVLLRARFLVCTSAALQRLAYLTGTPTLRLDVMEAFEGYPITGNGLHTLATPIDLSTGLSLPVDEMSTEEYLRHRHRYGMRRNTAAEVAAAVAEMQDGLESGWRETPAQSAYRVRLIERGAALAGRIPYVARWGPDAGFLGDGRLAAFQAAQLS